MKLSPLVVLVLLAVVASLSLLTGCDTLPFDRNELAEATKAKAERVASLEQLSQEVEADPDAPAEVRATVAARLSEAKAQAKDWDALLAKYEASQGEADTLSGIVSTVGSIAPIPAPFALLLSTVGGGLLTWLKLGKDAKGLRQLVTAMNRAKAEDNALAEAIANAKWKLRANLDTDVAARIDALRSSA